MFGLLCLAHGEDLSSGSQVPPIRPLSTPLHRPDVVAASRGPCLNGVLGGTPSTHLPQTARIRAGDPARWEGSRRDQLRVPALAGARESRSSHRRTAQVTDRPGQPTTPADDDARARGRRDRLRPALRSRRRRCPPLRTPDGRPRPALGAPRTVRTRPVARLRHRGHQLPAPDQRRHRTGGSVDQHARDAAATSDLPSPIAGGGRAGSSPDVRAAGDVSRSTAQRRTPHVVQARAGAAHGSPRCRHQHHDRLRARRLGRPSRTGHAHP